MTRLSIVVTTVGRPEAVEALMDSLSRSSFPDFEFILVDQSETQKCAEVVRRGSWAFPTRITSSGRGASVGRNAGLSLSEGEFVAFPDDGCTYPPDSLGCAVQLLEPSPAAGMSGILRTLNGQPSILRWPEHACAVTRRNFYRTKIESTMFFRRSHLLELGGFDPLLGTGSASPYQSGEISDVVLRGMEAGFTYFYDPRVVVIHPDVQEELSPAYPDKMEGYGRGFGRVFAQHHLSLTLLATLVGRKTVAGVVRRLRGDTLRAAGDRQWAIGVIQGYRDWRRRGH